MPSAFETRLLTTAETVQQALEQILGKAPASGEIERPPRLLAAMRHGALNGGKRLRPFLLLESAKLFGAEGTGVLHAACALELVHCYSLIHDDLPAMDDDDLRRGKPTVHKAYDVATAILAGDALLTLAFAVICDPQVHPDGAVRAELAAALATAAGPGGMAGGQMLDLEAEASNHPLAENAIRQLQAMKTGALIRFACEAGAILGNASGRERARIGDFGARLGLLFQITDDILDAESDAATLGKEAGKDAARNKATLISLLGLEATKALRDSEENTAAQLLAPFADKAATLRDTLTFACRRKH